MASPRITVVKHPMALEQVTLARDRRSDQVIFRKAIFRLGRMLAYEFLRTLETKEVLVETPLEKTRGEKIKGNDKIVVVMILRASIPFVEGMYKMLPMARTGIISAWRGEPPDFSIEVSYAKIPTIHEDDIVIIADPMLATGHTLVEVANRVMARGKPKRLVFFSVISARQGINYVRGVYPNAEFYTCAIDRKLNEKGYIVPGLGDAGDRAFGPPY